MSDDWMMMSERDAAVLESCGEDEACILLQGQLVKFPKRTIAAMMLTAHMHATEDALKQLGVDYALETGTGECGLGHSFSFRDGTRFTNMTQNIDVVAETMMVEVTLTDGRTGKGFSKIRRLRPH